MQRLPEIVQIEEVSQRQRITDEEEEIQGTNEIPCRIFDWRTNESIEFRSMIQEG